ncbi:MAG: imelysin family protein [Pseudomonadota bacterium]
MSTRSTKAYCAAALLLGSVHAAHATDTRAVINHYADIAQAGYSDSLATAQLLQTAVRELVSKPGPKALLNAKVLWKAAREPYQQTEVYRFGNAYVDEWEGKVNAWPLDEGLIDYVSADYGTDSDENAFYTVNVVANAKLTASGKTMDAGNINDDLLRSLHEVDEVEANVATGYHAIEFLLWGQDLNGTDAGAGSRPWTDYASGTLCTGGSCDRRGAYLQAAADLLVADLKDVVLAWSQGGEARKALEGMSDTAALGAALTGMGSLSYGELAGERMRLGLMLHDPEEEHDCFSDNTHNSHYFDALGIENIYLGRYKRADGEVMTGPSLSQLVAKADADLDAQMRAALAKTLGAMSLLKHTADSGRMSYDQMLAEGNGEGNAIVQAAVDALVDQTRSIERIAKVLNAEGLTVEGSDSLDDPTKVFQ